MPGARSRSSAVSNSGVTGSSANQSLRRAVRQTGLAGEQVNHQQVAQLPGHAHDQRPQPAVAVSPGVVDAAAGNTTDTASASGPALAPAWTNGRGERSSSSTQARRCSSGHSAKPRRKSGQRHQLTQRLVVKPGVLPDVERREVEPERIHRAQHRQHVARGDAARAHLHERGVQVLEIGGQFGRPRVNGGRRARRRRSARWRELEQQQTHVLLPWFLGGFVQNRLAAFPGLLHEPRQPRGKRRGRTLDVVREAQAAGEMAQLPPEHVQPAGAQFGQRLARGVGRDERVPVAVAADPGAETQPGQRTPVTRSSAGSKPRILPRQRQAAVQPGDRPRKDFPEIDTSGCAARRPPPACAGGSRRCARAVRGSP